MMSRVDKSKVEEGYHEYCEWLSMNPLKYRFCTCGLVARYIFLYLALLIDD